MCSPAETARPNAMNRTEVNEHLARNISNSTPKSGEVGNIYDAHKVAVRFRRWQELAGGGWLVVGLGFDVTRDEPTVGWR